MQIFKYSFPIAAIVGTIAWIMLDSNYSDVPWDHRVWITFGAAVLSGILAFFLFRKEKEDKVDKKK